MAQPHDIAQRYLFNAVDGTKEPYDNVKPHAADISKNLGGGSGNWPIQIAVGAAINDDPAGQDLGPFLRGENGWGLNGNEHGSSIYESWNAASVVALIHKARRYQPGRPGRQDAIRWIKAEIAKYCLSLKLHRPTRSILFVEGQGDTKPQRASQWDLEPHPPDGWSYPASNLFGARLYPVMPGSRQIERFNRHDSTRPQEATLNVDRNMMAPFVSWALGIERKFPQEVKSRSSWGWPFSLMETVIGKKFHQKTDPQAFGLTAQDVKTFRKLGDRQDPKPLLPYLEGYRSTAGQQCHWIQLRNGDVAAWQNKTIHPATTGCVLVWTEGKRVFWVSPQSTIRAAGAARCRREGDEFIVSATGSKLKNAPVERRFRPFERADQLWEVVWDSNGFRLVDGPGPGPGPGPEVVRFPEHDGLIGLIGALATRYSGGSPDRSLLEALGEMINRQGGRKGQTPLSAQQRGPEVVAAAEAVRQQARQLPAHEQRHPEHAAAVDRTARLLARYGQGTADRLMLEAAGELINRHGARRGGAPLAASERRQSCVEASEAVLAHARGL